MSLSPGQRIGDASAEKEPFEPTRNLLTCPTMHGSWKSGSTTAVKDAICSNGTPTIWVQGANRHTYAKPAEGTKPCLSPGPHSWILSGTVCMDDFFTCDSTTSPCAWNLDIMTQTCIDLSFTLNPSKLVHPMTCLTLLGIEIDSIRQETRIEASHLNDTLALLAAWEGRSHCTKRQLESLLGTLNFICNVCRLGRTFMHRLVNLLSKPRSPPHHIHLTCQSN